MIFCHIGENVFLPSLSWKRKLGRDHFDQFQGRKAMARNNTQQLDVVCEAHLWLRNITCERLCGYPPEGSSREKVVNCTIFQTKLSPLKVPSWPWWRPPRCTLPQLPWRAQAVEMFDFDATDHFKFPEVRWAVKGILIVPSWTTICT